jgi:hypothetical protein
MRVSRGSCSFTFGQSDQAGPAQRADHRNVQHDTGTATAAPTADIHQPFPQDDQFAKGSTCALSGRLQMGSAANGVAKKSRRRTRQPLFASS